MEVKFSKRFTKQYQVLPQKIQQKFDQRLALWQEDPTNPLLNHHVLKGKLKGMHSINITGDYRAIYDETNEFLAVYEMIGTHPQLYG